MKLFIVFYKSGCSGIVLKLDYEKSYDRVNWDFLLDTLRKRGFGFKWVSWIRRILHNGSVGVQVNNVEGEYFETGKGLRQGDPLSPILFNLVVDVLTKMLSKATSHGLISGLGAELIPDGVVSLQYADDTILFLENDINKAKNLKNILTCFELMSGMKINYDKSEMIPMNLEDYEEKMYAGNFGLPCWGFPHQISRDSSPL